MAQLLIGIVGLFVALDVILATSHLTSPGPQAARTAIAVFAFGEAGMAVMVVAAIFRLREARTTRPRTPVAGAMELALALAAFFLILLGLPRLLFG